MNNLVSYRRRGEYAWLVIAMMFCFFFVSAGHSTEENSSDIIEAARPLGEGVPEVAAGRLRELLKNAQGEERWRAVAIHLIPALIAEDQPNDALALLNDPRLKNVALTRFWRGQILTELGRWNEALAAFREVQADLASPVRTEATFGAAEMLRALGQTDAALRELATLLRDKQ